MAAMKVLVTGGAGFIGSHIADKLVEKGHEVVVVDNLSTGSRDNVNAMCTFYELDITDARLEQIFCREKPQIVIHHAAQIEVPKSLAAPALDANVNILGTINILECCRRYGVTKLVYASSAAVYGTPAYLPIDEKHPINPLSNYGVSKYAAELYIKCFAQLYGLDYTVLRYANVYGPRQSHSGEGGVISIFASGLLAGKAPLIQGNGSQTRDFVYVGDIVEANLRAMAMGTGTTFNIGTGMETSINALADQLGHLTGSVLKPLHGAERPGDIGRSVFNPALAQGGLQWVPVTALKEGLRRTVAFYQTQ